jgi:hypothetical protein
MLIDFGISIDDDIVNQMFVHLDKFNTGLID